MGHKGLVQTQTATVARSRSTAVSPRPAPQSAHPLLTLQRQIGNRAVTQMLQAKMTVGKPNDAYEHEADRIADTVMGMPAPVVQRQAQEEEPAQAKLLQRQPEEEPAQAKPLAGTITPLIQRQGEEEEPAQAKLVQRQAEEEEPAQAKLLQRQAEEEEPAQTKLLQRQAEGEEPAQAKPLQRQPEDETAQAKGSDATTVSPAVESSIQAMRGGGRPLPDETRSFYETRMGYDLSGVRIHADANANDVATHLNAQAFTLGQDVFFGAGRYEPQTNSGKWLLAHELTHTVQQSPQPMRVAAKPSQTSAATTPLVSKVQRYPLLVTAAPARAQRLFGIEVPGIDTVRNWAADRAANIPGFTMLTVILGRNPINDRPVERNATNLIRGALGLIPGGDLIFQGLQASGALERVGTWLREQIAQLNITWEGIVGLFSQALRSLGVRDLANISGAGERILNIFRPTLDRIRAFAASVGSRVLQFIKEAILRPVGQFAQRLPFYPLLTVILGQDPITDQEVPRNATNVIRGILLILPGGEEKFQNLQRSGIIDRAFNWFNQELNRLNLTWNYIKSVFVRLWETLSVNDLLSPSKAFERIRGIFGEPVQRITTFAGAAIRKVAEFIFEGVLTLAGGLGQQVLRVFNRARGVFSSIIENPIGFVGNLVNAVKRGFQQFSGNILTHLRAGLIGWLLGALAGSGLQLPERFDLRGIVSLVMQVLGLTYQRLRGILVRLLGSEERVQRAEQVFDFLVTLVRDGIGAAWERIVEFAGNLQEMVIGGIRDWVARTVVGQAIARLVTLFNPAGAIIQAIMAIYNTVVFFIERAQQIGALVEAVFESIANIAGGNIGAAASYVERTMARSIPVMLGFLARFIGLGNVGEQIQTVIRRIQAPIENAMNRVANWIVTQVRRLVRSISSGVQSGVQRIAGWLGLRRQFRTVGGATHSLFFRGEGRTTQLTIRSTEMSLENFLADLATKYAGDSGKLTKVRLAQTLVEDIKRLTTAGTAPAATGPAVDAEVQGKVDQLGPILSEIGDGVSTDGATAGYRGLHWWTDQRQTQAQAETDPQYLANLARQELGAQQLSDAVRAVLDRRIPPGTIPTQADIETSIAVVNNKVATLRDGTNYVAEGKTYHDRFHFLLGRYVTKLQAVRTRFASASRIVELDAEIIALQSQISGLASDSQEYYFRKRLLVEAERERRQAARGLPSVYRDLTPEVTASPFIATSLSARKAAEYALGSLFTPSGKARRTRGQVGRLLIFVATVTQLTRDGTYSIDELARERKIKIRNEFTENELTFTGSIPGEYLKATLEVQADQSEDTVASSAMGRAAAEASRFGGLR
ncbi:DUF4157 domain-containing protein [Nodosilinea sp. PGN35]|uniref:eCIS core domain-containing protein n=1 Tax=Nodosilinea sp. PGN35 TaxID=3020489 RepID=UPI0023B22719|nr:DUF4157 domain-containing protein [Nodosilinea sp. TSF1-S3]MDF0367878.1 DUF4157 domain-containing protein [Nodosilinea sp. TSF1-S3]